MRNPTDAKLVWEAEGYFGPGEFSPDASKFLVWQYLSAAQTKWYVFDVASGEHTQITPDDPPQYFDGGLWTHDGGGVYLTSDKDGDFRKLYRCDLATGEWTLLTGDIPWNVESIAVEPQGKGIAFVTNEDGIARLYFADEWGRNRKQLAGLPDGLIEGLSFAAGGGVLGFTMNSSRSSSDAYTVAYPGGAVTQWTQSEVGGLDTAKFVEPELIHFPTFDQVDGQPRQIPAFYYPAPGPGPHPVVIYAHGGPESQFRPTFASLFSILAQ